MPAARSGLPSTGTVSELRRRALQRMLQRDGASIGDIAEVLEQDAALRRLILYVTNAALPPDRTRVDRLEEALVLLGLRRVAALVSGATAYV